MAAKLYALELRVFLFDLGHGVIDALTDVRLFGGGMHQIPAGRRGHPEHAFRRVFITIFGVGAWTLIEDFRMALGEPVRDVLQEDEAQYHMLVVGGVQMAAQLVGGGPEFGFQALAGVFGLGLLGWAARHGVPFAFVML